MQLQIKALQNQDSPLAAIFVLNMQIMRNCYYFLAMVSLGRNRLLQYNYYCVVAYEIK